MRATILIALSAAAFAQTPRPEFEAATVKLAAPTGSYVPRGGPGTADPKHVNYRSLSMKNLLMAAYDLPIGRITGPAWIDSERYDIAASLAPGTTQEQVAVMLQNLLADRFQLTVHHETHDMALFELSVGEQPLGPGLKPHVQDPIQLATGQLLYDKDGVPVPRPGGLIMSMIPGRRRVRASKQPTKMLAALLAAELDRPVIDQTGLVGDYDFSLDFLPEGPLASLGVPVPGADPVPISDAPSLQFAVRDQLGLRLESKRGPIEILVVDRGEKTPTEN